MTELLPTRVTYRPGQRVEIEVRALDAPGTLSVWHLGDPVSSVQVEADGVVELGELPPGGYGAELGAAATALDVAETPPLRYGFVTSYAPDRTDIAAVQDNLRRLHLTDLQFYDWAYRHADLVGGGSQYADALGQPVSLATVRALIEAGHDVGATALGYAAVYGVGNDEWPKWEHDALLTASGSPYGLGDFLSLVDPAAADWLGHFAGDLVAASGLGFDGFHLDQYGYPKQAYRPDGTRVDLARSFTSLIEAVRDALPQSRLVFNNVNDFPTWATARAPQDAVYIEVWPPHVGLEHLAQTATRARSVAGGKPVVVAAYQHVYADAPVEAADAATALTMATLFSHGATHLLAGEADRILVDPYYVRNHRIGRSTAELLHRYYDFAVAHTELLFDPGIVDVTASLAGAYNDDLDVSYASTPVTHLATPGTVWRRITQVCDRYVLHLVNLAGQVDTHWDAPRRPPAEIGTARLRIRGMGRELPRVRYADPDSQNRLRDLDVVADGDYAHVTLPAPHTWQLVVVEPFSRRP
jgi:dextranase